MIPAQQLINGNFIRSSERDLIDGERVESRASFRNALGRNIRESPICLDRYVQA